MRLAFHARLALAVVLCAACSDSTAPTISLTDQEIGLLFTEMSSVAAVVPVNATVGTSTTGGDTTIGRESMPALTSTNMSTTVDCARGGTATVAGSASETLTGATINVTESFANCGSEHFTIGGSLRVIATISLPNDTTFTLHATVRGTLNVTHVDGRTGSCRVDVTANVTSTGLNESASISGTVCGRSAATIDALSG